MFGFCHFCHKKWDELAEAKKLGFFEKKRKTYAYCESWLANIFWQIDPLSIFNVSAKQKVKEFVFTPLFLGKFICIICINYVCLYLSIFIYEYSAYSRGHGWVFWGVFFGKKGILLAQTPLTDDIALLLTISNKNIFSKLRAMDWER